MSLGKSLQKETAEERAEDLDGQQEFTAACDPPVMVWGQTTGGDDAVQVGMEVKVLSPGMEHVEEPGFHPQALGVAGNGEQGISDGAEEHVVDDLLVVEGDGGDRRGEREDHVKVWSGQQLGGTLGQPFGACRTLALGAVPVPAGAVTGVSVLTLVAPFDDTAQQRSAAGFDGPHGSVVMQGQRVGVPVGGAVLSKDVGQLQGWRGHQRLERLLFGGLSSRSSGLAVLPMVAGETAV
jgi:hypothetical protein